MAGSKSKKHKTAAGKGGKIAFAVCILIIAVLLCAVIYLLAGRSEKEETPKRNTVINPENVGEVVSQLSEDTETVPLGTYEVTMNSTWKFLNGTGASENAYVENATTNTNDVYFDIVRSDTGETIYESPILPVGSYLEDITLDKSLEAGTYDCVLIYHLVDENQKSISTVRIGLTIIVEN